MPIHVEEPLVPLFFTPVFRPRSTFSLRCFLIYSEKCDKVGFDPTSDGKEQDQKEKETAWLPAWLRGSVKVAGEINGRQRVTEEKILLAVVAQCRK